MNKILDIDIDFFMNKIFYKNKKLDKIADDYKFWDIEDIHSYLKINCNLENKKHVGASFLKHVELFYYLRDLILSNKLEVPFDIIHIDSHADLSYSFDLSGEFISQEWIYKSLKERIFPENISPKNSIYNSVRMDSTNFLYYMIACEWINSITYVYNEDIYNHSYIDIPKLEEDYMSHLKKKGKLDLNCKIISKNKDKQISIDLKLISMSNFKLVEDVNFVFFTKSPEYTPENRDNIFEQLVNDYIIKI
ncbi:MAG: hypothetical protein ACPKPY_02810 [Nitrososphaeraceae archaeon]